MRLNSVVLPAPFGPNGAWATKESACNGRAYSESPDFDQRRIEPDKPGGGLVAQQALRAQQKDQDAPAQRHQAAQRVTLWLLRDHKVFPDRHPGKSISGPAISAPAAADSVLATAAETD
jgi:hypothetical protein